MLIKIYGELNVLSQETVWLATVNGFIVSKGRLQREKFNI